MKEELEEVRKGATWQNVYDTFWHIATVRYATYELLKQAFPKDKMVRGKKAIWCEKCVTPKKLDYLVEKKFLTRTADGVLTATARAVEFLDVYSDYNTAIIKPAQGQGGRDMVYNTSIFLEALWRDDFFALFYPDDIRQNPKDDQPFLRPDAALILRQGDQAKLVFLEVERKKPDWENHIQGKRRKYEIMAEREETWSVWWRRWCDKLKFKHCAISDFGFSVWCIGEFRADWDGWSFKNTMV